MALLDYMEAYRILERHGIRSIESRYVKNAEEAVDFSKNRSIVLKVISQKAMHKTKSGLVALDLNSREKVMSAYSDLEKKAKEFAPFKILAQEMAKKGIEIIIGGNTDPQFGKLILIGLGGIYVETFKDAASRVCPISDYDARAMLLQLKSHSVIAPTPESEKMLVELLLKASRMFMETKISELDLNPVIINEDGYKAVDIRMID